MEGVRGVSYRSDVAIDNIAFRNGSCERLGMYTSIFHFIFEISKQLTLRWINLVKLSNDISNMF